LNRLWLVLWALTHAAFIVYGQGGLAVGPPFTLRWTEGRCKGCKIAVGLGRIQFVSRSEAWGVGCTYLPSQDFVVVRTDDAGRTWTEVSQTAQHAGDADGPPAFSFLDSERGWIGWWDLVHEPNIIVTRSAGQDWKPVSHELVQKVRFIDDRVGYGTAATSFKRTDDGGHTWAETHIPHLHFIDRMFFVTPERGWLAGSDGRDLLVFRTTNGGRDWEESRASGPKDLGSVRDIFFLDQNRGWLVAWHSDVKDISTYLYSTVDGGRTWALEPDAPFQGKSSGATVVRFVSEMRGFAFVEQAQHSVMYTADGGAHWSRQVLPHSVYDCQVFEGDLLCSAWPGFSLLTVHPK